MSENGIVVVRLNGKEYECDAELADAFMVALESVKAEWRKMITEFTKDCEAAPIAVMGEMGPGVGRIFLEQAKREWTEQARSESGVRQ